MPDGHTGAPSGMNEDSIEQSGQRGRSDVPGVPARQTGEWRDGAYAKAQDDQTASWALAVSAPFSASA